MTKSKDDEKGIPEEKECTPEPECRPAVMAEQGAPDGDPPPCRKLTDKLYECLAAGNCSFKLLFGTTSFCSWLLHNHAQFPAKKPPCGSTDARQ